MTVTTNTKELAKDLQVILEDKLGAKVNNPTAKEIIEQVIEGIFTRVANGETVKLGSYGNFVPKVQAARTCRNPQSGETMEVPEKNAVGFKVQKKLKELLNA